MHMAKIILKTELNNVLLEKQLKSLEKSIQSISASMSKVTVNKNLTTQLNALTKNYKALQSIATKTIGINNKVAIQDEKLAQAKAKTAKELARQNTEEAKAATQKIKLEKAVLSLKRAQEKEAKAQEKATTAVKENTKANEENEQSITSMMKGFARWQLVATLVMRPLNLIRQAYADLNETLIKTEDSVIELQRVLGNEFSDKKLGVSLYNLAIKYGQTFEVVDEIALNFAKTGMSTKETLKATEAALLGVNTADLQPGQASEGMIAIMSQMELTANDLQLVIDKLNITADNAAVSTEKLLAALQRTGATAKNANLSLDQTVSIITALSEKTGRSGESIGTALNALIQFSQKDTSLNTFSKLSIDMARTVENFRHGSATILDIWRQLSIEISTRKDSNENILGTLFEGDDWRSLNTELQEELGENFATITEIYDTASTFRKNYFIALLDNMEGVDKALETISKAQGYSQNENLKYLDTYTARLNQLEARWQKFLNDEQGWLGFKKGLIDVGNWLLSATQKLGGLSSVFRTIVAIVAPILGAKALSKTIALSKTLFTTLKTGALSLQSAFGWVSVVAGALSLIAGISEGISQERKQAISDSLTAGTEAQSSLEETISNISKSYSEMANSVVNARRILNDSTATDEQKELAQQKLLEIQNKLIDSNNKYAQSVDVVNGKLETQIENIKGISLDEIRSQITDFYNKNVDSFANAEKYWNNEKITPLDFDESAHAWSSLDVKNIRLLNWLKENGYGGMQDVGMYDNWVVGLGRAIAGVFGAKTAHTAMLVPIAEQLDVLNELIDKINADESLSEIDREYLLGQVQAQINARLDPESDYAKAKSLLFGDENANTLVGRLTSDEIRKIVSGEMSDAELSKLLADLNTTERDSADVSSEIAKNYSSILESIEKARDIEQQRLDIEKARQALIDKQKERSVAVFNAETGEMEWHANDKEIADLQDAGISAILKELNAASESGELNDALLTALFEKWADAGMTSNSDFRNIASQFGVSFGATDKTAHSFGSDVVNNSNNVSNTSQTYVINGVTIPAAVAQTQTIAELFENFDLVG